MLENQELEMNGFFFPPLSNTLSNKNVIGPKPEPILGLDLFQYSKFNQLGFCKYQSILPFEMQLPFSRKSAFHLKKDNLFNSKKCSLLVLYNYHK